jgi:predicted ATP-dependent protease
LCLKEKLKYLDNSGIEKIIKYSSILAGCEKKLSIRIDEIVDLIREANFLTEEDGSMLICDRHIQEAVKASRNRESAFYEYTIEDICNDRILIETSGSAIGQVNILTIREFEKFVFGIPARVTCSVSSGNGDFIDIEHETEQGGNLHKRGRLTMLGFFANCFGRDVSVANLNTVLCVEQVFGEIDGDSATLAETCAFFSALANIPILQHMAITGSMDQRGNIQAIGNVNEKIEGFFRVCEAKRKKNTLKIPNIVIIPYVNKFELNLNKDIVNACNNGIFEIYQNWNKRITTSTLNEWLKITTERNTPPLVNGRQVKIKYANQIKRRPPTFCIFTNTVNGITDNYIRYLKNSIAKDFKLYGVPIRINIKASATENPYANKPKPKLRHEIKSRSKSKMKPRLQSRKKLES